MTVYELMNQVIYCGSFEERMRNLIELAAILDKERYTSRLLDCFYERTQIPYMELYDFGMDSIMERPRYCILEGEAALPLYIVLTMPVRKKPKQTLKELENYAKEQLTLCKEGRGYKVSEKIIKEILQYLNEKYQFFEKVFKSTKVAFLILDIKNQNYTSQCLTLKFKEGFCFAFFFYLISDEWKTNRTAEEDVFYVLSLALITQFTGEVNEIPDKFIKLLKDSCIPEIEKLDKDSQKSILATLLSVGLMYGSPFQKFDTNNYIQEDEKKIFNTLVTKMLETM